MRPQIITDEHLAFLDDLRESGATNMLGATPYLVETFPELTEEDSRTVLIYWMQTFGDKER